jgi:hypothetical protein
MHLIHAKGISDELMGDVLARDCVLWLTTTTFSSEISLERLIEITGGPWRGIFVESTAAEFGSALAARNHSIDSADATGAFTHLIAADPTSLQLQRRAKPVFFLNGRSDRDGTESASIPTRSAVRRRLNMTAKLRELEPRRVVVVGERPDAAIEELAALWDVDFRSLLTVVTDDESFPQRAEAQLQEIDGLNVVHWIAKSPIEFATSLLERLRALSALASIPVAAQLPGGAIVNIDLARAELAEQPLADLCDFVRLQDTFPVSPEDLREEEFQAFFTRGSLSWRPFAAGLPWMPDDGPEKDLLAALRSQLADPPSSVQVLSILSEPGAGGTTQARALALAAAKAGFPVLVVKQESPVPLALELTGFLFRASREAANQAAELGLTDAGEPVWLIVLDVQHGGRGTDDLQRLCAELARSGRKVAILKVSLASSPLELPESIAHQELVFVQHELESSDVEHLGAHLNVYLRPHGKQKSREQWISFWTAHQPDLDAGVASFWIALEFWLAGFLPLGESIQGWVVQQFKNLRGRPELQRALLEIGALSIERRATPERLLALLSSPKLPWTVALDVARSDSPGLGLVGGESFPYGRVWAIAHDVLARHLIDGVWNDRLLCEDLEIAPLEDSVALRLTLIANLSKRAAMGEPFAKPFALSLATSVLKLDEQNGNAEFFKHWRQVIEILESVPQVVRLTSRTFNHHLAISRRRVTQDDYFHLDLGEKRTLLRQAAKDVEFALDQIEPSQEDEPTLNLLNTLALLFQDLADLERNGGDAAELARLLAKSDAITNRALKENPNNSYVLETAAKNQLRQGMTSGDASERIESAAKALSFVFQASRLDTAASRKMKLGQLAAQALKVLRDNNAVTTIERLCALGSPYGFIAKAWSALPIAAGEEATLALESISPDAAEESIRVLNSAPERNWLLVRLLYDLVVIASPHDFQGQLRILDELASTKGYQLSLQQVLERAVLLFIAGQHKQAIEEFKWLRPRAKESQVVVSVPSRLRWLPTPDRTARAVCTAQVVDSSADARGMAKVKELGGAWAPFNPQEFGKSRMAPNEQFKCQVTFAAMGPFLKPVDQSHR